MKGITRASSAARRGSRSVPAAAFSMTLADVLARVNSDKTLSRRQREDMASALRSLAKVLGRELAEVPAQPTYLRTRLKGYTPAMAGKSAERWANILSLVRKAQTLAGLGDEHDLKRAPFLPTWTDLLALIADDYLKYRLTAFARYCSALHVLPDRVDDGTLLGFRGQLEQTELVKRPQDTHRALCIAWNRAIDTVPGWPQLRVAVPQYRDWYSLDWEAFPTSLTDEVEKYLHYLTGTDVLNGCPVPLRPASIKSRKAMLRAYLSAIVIRGLDVKTLTSLSEAVTLEAFKEALRFFLGRGADGKENKRLARQVADAIFVLARYWVKVDERQLAAMNDVRARLKDRDRPKGMGEKSRMRLKQFDDPKQVRALANLSWDMAKPLLEKKGKPTYREARRFQTAVAIEILLLTVMRIQNVANLEIGRHLTWTGKTRLLHITIPGEEVKNGMPITRPMPEKSAELIEIYIQRYRPVLLKVPSDHLFPGAKGGARQKGDFSKQVSDCIRKEIGLVMHVHLFRHFAALTYLNDHPGAYGVVRLLHNNKSVDTTTKFYCGTETTSAFRHYDAHLAGLRQHDGDREAFPQSPASIARQPRAKKSGTPVSRDGEVGATEQAAAA